MSRVFSLNYSIELFLQGEKIAKRFLFRNYTWKLSFSVHMLLPFTNKAASEEKK